jgi:hypothetical protein
VRIRSIKPDFFRDPDTTGRWAAELKMFYVGLWCVADDSGRFAWDEDLIASDLYPFDRKADVGHFLEQLVEAGVVTQYEVDGRRYGYLKNFDRHQKINKPTPSRLPAPSEGTPVVLPESYGSPPGILPAGKERKGRDQGKEGKGGAEASSPPSPVVVVCPCVGHGAHDYAVTLAQVDEWAPVYPGIDVRAEVLKAKAWLDANPTKRKTQSGVPRFLVSWLGRAQDDAGRTGGKTGKPLAFAPAQPAEVFARSGPVAL